MTIRDAQPQATTAPAEGLRALVAEAWAATDVVADQVDPSTREAAFKMLLEAMLRNGAPIPAPDGESEPESQPQNGVGDQRNAADLGYSLADMFGISPEDVPNLFDVTDGEPKLILDHRKLSRKSAAATRELTLLVCAARDALRLSTPTTLIRSVAEAYDRLDSANFMSTLRSMDEVAVRGRPGSRESTLRLRKVGVDAARELAQRLVA